MCPGVLPANRIQESYGLPPTVPLCSGRAARRSHRDSRGPGVTRRRPEFGLDWAGIGAAAVCAVHCLVTPGLIVVAPILGAAFVGESTETVLLSASLGISSYAMTCGGVRSGRRWPAMLLVVCGAVTLLTVRAIGREESAVERACVLCGAGCLAGGHALNIRSCRRAITGTGVPAAMRKE
jgi:MerC mercury resistance protein